MLGFLLPYLPEWLIMNVFSGSIRNSVYPASDYFELVLAYGLEQITGRMRKAKILGRFRSVIDPFAAPDPDTLTIAVMIIESDNDPLVEPVLRSELKVTYPSAEVYTFNDAGHFPYLNQAEEYIRIIDELFLISRYLN